MNQRLLAMVAGLCLLAASLPVAPARAVDVLAVITKSRAADRNVSYRGIKYAVIPVGKRSDRAEFKIAHRKPGCTRTEYLSPKKIAGIMTIERDGQIWRYVPTEKRWRLFGPSMGSPSVTETLKNYNVADGGLGKVAGRAAYIIKLNPKKTGRPSETIWVDSRTYLTLKTEVKNSGGALASASAFKKIVFEPSDISARDFDTNPQHPAPSVSSGDLGFTITKPGYLPSGYELVQTLQTKIGRSRAVQLMYNNGVKTISVFERLRGGNSSDMPPGLGRTNMLRFERGKVAYIISGDISMKELEKIKASIK